MDGLDSLGPPADLPPLLAAGLDPVASSNSLWVKIERAINERALAPRATASLIVFRDLIIALTDMARVDSVSIAVGKALDQSGYLRDLRDERSEEAEARIENLAELVSAAREYEHDPNTLGGFADQSLPPRPMADGTRDAPWLMTLHSARSEFPECGGARRPLPHSRRETRRNSRAAPLLCGDD
jgi:superfamily I DNA/RNA helicase